MSKYLVKLIYGVHRKDGTFSGQQKSEMILHDINLDSAKKFIETSLFVEGDNVDDYGTCKLGLIGEEKEVWTVVRQTEEGEYRGIHRLYEI